jgi:hypothetical protein
VFTIPILAFTMPIQGVHHGPIPVFTIGRSRRARWADARTEAKQLAAETYWACFSFRPTSERAANELDRDRFDGFRPVDGFKIYSYGKGGPRIRIPWSHR